MCTIIEAEFKKICVEYWQGVVVVLGFGTVATVFGLLGGEVPSYEGIGKGVFSIFIVVALLAAVVFIERVYKAVKRQKR
jgi:hypothetical protein